MKSILAVAGCVALCAAVCLFAGCARGKRPDRPSWKDKHILDGPGMENTVFWDSFSISRTDSYAQHNFQISVKYYEDRYVVTGILRDEDGTEYDGEVELPEEARIQIDKLLPHTLPDVIPVESGDDDLIVLDAPEVQIEVAYTDGTLWQKVDENDFSLQVYEIVLPHFREKFN